MEEGPCLADEEPHPPHVHCRVHVPDPDASREAARVLAVHEIDLGLPSHRDFSGRPGRKVQPEPGVSDVDSERRVLAVGVRRREGPVHPLAPAAIPGDGGVQEPVEGEPVLLTHGDVEGDGGNGEGEERAESKASNTVWRVRPSDPAPVNAGVSGHGASFRLGLFEPGRARGALRSAADGREDHGSNTRARPQDRAPRGSRTCSASPTSRVMSHTEMCRTTRCASASGHRHCRPPSVTLWRDSHRAHSSVAQKPIWTSAIAS